MSQLWLPAVDPSGRYPDRKPHQSHIPHLQHDPVPIIPPTNQPQISVDNSISFPITIEQVNQLNLPVIFFDDFENVNLTIEKWTDYTGDWIVENGNFIILSNGKSYVNNNEWKNYIFQADIKSNRTVNKVLVFRFQKSSYGYGIDFRTAPYNDVVLVKANSNNGRIVASSPYNNANGIWYTMTIIIIENDIRVMVNGTEVIHYIDFENSFTTGGIGLGADLEPEPGSKVYFDNVFVIGKK